MTGTIPPHSNPSRQVPGVLPDLTRIAGDLHQAPPAVRLPADWCMWRIEALHELAWRDLLDLVPGALQTFLDQAARRIQRTADALGTGATVGFHGWCGSDLFVVCDECEGDRAVIEIKGPQARVNLAQGDVWQTDLYRDTYRVNPALACKHHLSPLPIFVLLDARNRTRQIIEKYESARAGVPLNLAGWVVLTYEEILSAGPFDGQPLSGWLLGH